MASGCTSDKSFFFRGLFFSTTISDRSRRRMLVTSGFVLGTYRSRVKLMGSKQATPVDVGADVFDVGQLVGEKEVGCTGNGHRFAEPNRVVRLAKVWFIVIVMM